MWIGGRTRARSEVRGGDDADDEAGGEFCFYFLLAAVSRRSLFAEWRFGRLGHDYFSGVIQGGRQYPGKQRVYH